MANLPQIVKFIGYEFSIEEPYFLVKGKSKYYLLTPRVDDDVIRDFIGAPTIKSFLDGTWDVSKYEGGYKYIDVIPAGAIICIVDIVEVRAYGLGITYDYLAKIKNIKNYNNIIVNVDSLVKSKFRMP